MLVTLCFWSALLAAAHASITNISASDPAVVFTPGWTQNVSAQGIYMQTESFLCHLTATLPPSATSVSYVGYKRAAGSTYGYSLDCVDDCILQTVNGTDPSVTDDATAPQVMLFTLQLDPSSQHTLRVYNLASSLANGPSQITFDHLSVLVQDNDGSPSGIQSAITSSPTAASPATVALVSSIASSSPTLGSTGDAASSVASLGSSTQGITSHIEPTSTLPILPISPSGTNASSSGGASAGGGVSRKLVIGLTVFAVVVTGAIVILLVVYLRRRRREQRSRYSSDGERASIIPIMPPPPPQMRTTSLDPFTDPFAAQPNPFADPFSVPVVGIPLHSPARSSPSSAPTIPLPNLPPDARVNRMQSRSNSPATSVPKNDMWIARTPVKTEFFAV